MPYVTLSASFTPLWNMGFRLGIGRVEVRAEYSDSKMSGRSEYIDNTALMLDLFCERWLLFMEGLKGGFAARYINSQHETSDYLEYMNLGSAQAILYLQFNFKNFGVLK